MSTPTPEPQPLSSPEPSQTALLEREAVEQEVEPGDRERFSHYADKNAAMESALTGAPVKAICGKVWVPGRDAKKFPVCPICKEIYEGIRKREDNDDSGD